MTDQPFGVYLTFLPSFASFWRGWSGPPKRELYFTGRSVDAGGALSLGLVNRVVPDEQLHDVTMELARSLAHGPAVALALMKRNMPPWMIGCFIPKSSVMRVLIDVRPSWRPVAGDAQTSWRNASSPGGRLPICHP
jgi:enoyl-CoA hydratase/isomerase-like protein